MTPDLLDTRSHATRRAGRPMPSRSCRCSVRRRPTRRRKAATRPGSWSMSSLAERPPHQCRGRDSAAGRRARPLSRIILDRRLRRVNSVSRVQRGIAMNFLRQIADSFSRWLDGVASAVVAILGWLAAPRTGSACRTSEWNFHDPGAGGQIVAVHAGEDFERRRQLFRRGGCGLERQPGRAGDAAGTAFSSARSNCRGGRRNFSTASCARRSIASRRGPRAKRSSDGASRPISPATRFRSPSPRRRARRSFRSRKPSAISG